MFRRGFKTESENEAVQWRSELGLQPHSPLRARSFADELGVRVMVPRDIPGMDRELLGTLAKSSDAWSAFTLPAPDRHVVVLNSWHSPARQEIDLMHELAHLLLEHSPSVILTLGANSLPLRQFISEHEEEASWFGGVLQLPRTALVWALRQGMSNGEVAHFYGASMDMVGYRRRMTGVDRQLGGTSKVKR